MSFTDKIFIYFYRFLISPLALTLMFFFGYFLSAKIKNGMQMRWPRNGSAPWLTFPVQQHPIWFHCASGEFENAIPVIELIKEKAPHTKILVTFFTPSYRDKINNHPLVDMATPLPWDLPGSVRSFLKHHQPKALLISRSDLWPEVLYQVKSLGIPSLLFAAPRVELKGALKLFYPIVNKLFSWVDDIYWVDEKGDTRYDRVLKRLKNPVELKIIFNSETPLFIAGSTWPEDEEKILAPLCAAQKMGSIKLIVAPHEPNEDHLALLEKNIAKQGLNSQRYSQATTWPDNSVLIIDVLGILAFIYAKTDIAFIGGSFKQRVHSVMEALAAGNPVILGPKYRTNPEALMFEKLVLSKPKTPVVKSVKSSAELDEHLQLLIENQSSIINWKLEIKKEVEKNQGASQLVVDWLKEL